MLYPSGTTSEENPNEGALKQVLMVLVSLAAGRADPIRTKLATPGCQCCSGSGIDPQRLIWCNCIYAEPVSKGISTP